MKFCPKCGMRLSPINKKKDKKKIILLTCPKCGYEQPTTPKKLTLPEDTKQTSPKEKITIISKEEAKLRTLPTLKTQCPKCSNNEAYWWMVQTRGADESTTQFFRCTKCGHTWREMA